MSEVKWLVKDKFKDDDDGRAALAKSYSEIQGKADKANTKIAEFEKTIAGLEPVKKLNDFILKDKQTMQFLKMRKDQIETGKTGDVLEPPVRPTDYELLDTETPGTSSYDYAKKLKEYDNTVLKQSMQKEFKDEIGKIKTSIADNLKTSKSTEDLHKALVGLGYSDEEIEDYEKFYSDPKNATIENTVELHGLKTGKLIAISPALLQKRGFQLSNIVPGMKDIATKPDPEAETEMKRLMELSD